jgi:signal peptidase
MSGTFEKGALVVGKIPSDDTVIEKDAIISFRQKVNGVTIINTHRVVDVQNAGGVDTYQTQGDNREICPAPDEEWKTIYDVTAVYKFHIPAVGGFIDFLKEPLGFVLCLVLPMLAFIAWQVYKLISIYIQGKKEQMLEEAKDNVSDEAKDAIIREYLAKMQAQAESTEDNAPVEEAVAAEESKEENNADKGE